MSRLSYQKYLNFFSKLQFRPVVVITTVLKKSLQKAFLAQLL